VQRLFSTFPNSWPGLGLLILRFATGLSLAAVAHIAGDRIHTVSLLARCVVDGVAVMIWIGLWTPLAAVAAAAIQIGFFIFGNRLDVSLLIFAAAAVSLSLLGPGAWSFDARSFGRKRIM
jgi:putative oxidoreductase